MRYRHETAHHPTTHRGSNRDIDARPPWRWWRRPGVVLGLLLALWLAGPGCVESLKPCGRACQRDVDCQWGSPDYFCEQNVCTGKRCDQSTTEPHETIAQEPTTSERRDGTDTQTPEPVQDAAPEPHDEPSSEPRREPTPEPRDEPTPEPRQEVASEPTFEAPPEPTQDGPPPICPQSGEFNIVVNAKSGAFWGVYAHFNILLDTSRSLSNKAERITRTAFLDAQARSYIFKVTLKVRPKTGAPCAIRSVGVELLSASTKTEVTINYIDIGLTRYIPDKSPRFVPESKGISGALQTWKTPIDEPGWLRFDDVSWRPNSPPTPPGPAPNPIGNAVGKPESQGTFQVNKSALEDQKTMVASIGGQTYMVWLDGQQQLVVAEVKYAGGVQVGTKKILVSSGDLSASKPDINKRVGASIGMDSQGHLHVAGQMLHAPFDSGRFRNDTANAKAIRKLAWRYWVTTKAGDISTLTLVTDTSSQRLPGCGITTPTFHRDRRGVLYASFAHQVGDVNDADISSTHGRREGLAIARYDAIKKIWTMLGGDNYGYTRKLSTCDGTSQKVSNTTFFIPCDTASCPCPTNNAGCHNATQRLRAAIHFDPWNNMHIAWGYYDGRKYRDAQAGTSYYTNRFSHLMYARLNDGETTFRKADGTPYKDMPITPKTADIALAIPTAAPNDTPLRHHISIATGILHGPILGANVYGENPAGKQVNEGYVVVWDANGKWNPPKLIDSGTKSATQHARLYGDPCGTLFAMSGHLFRSTDDGQSWQNYDLIGNTNGAFVSVDIMLLQTHAMLRVFSAKWSTSDIIDTDTRHIFNLSPNCANRQSVSVYP